MINMDGTEHLFNGNKQTKRQEKICMREECSSDIVYLTNGKRKKKNNSKKER